MAGFPGRFVTFEGGEGTGKSTQIARLRERLERLGRTVLSTREPGGSPRAERIRDLLLSGKVKPLGPLAEALMFSAARADHLDGTIRPALARGEIVLCDRFADSTAAYQGVLGAVDPACIRALERAVVQDTRPDLTVILDLPAEIGLWRARSRRDRAEERVDRFEAEDTAFHRKLRQAFRTIAESHPDRCVLVDGDGEIDEVEERVWRAVEERLRLNAQVADGVA